MYVSKLADVAKRAVWPSLVFNISNEPAYHYNLCMIVDTSSEEESRTSYITRNQAIYLETESDRFEICGSDGKYSVARINDPYDKDNEFMLAQAIPLKSEHKETLVEGLSWGQLQWTDSSLTIDSISKRIEPIRNYKVYDKRL